MADINAIINIFILLTTAIKTSDYRNVYRLLLRLRVLCDRLKLDMDKISPHFRNHQQYIAIQLTCHKFEKQIDRLCSLLSPYFDERENMSEAETRNTSSDSDTEDEEVRLSADAAAALQEFYLEQHVEEQRLIQGQMDGYQIREDWQMSQFWYDDRTATVLAKEALAVAGENGSIACLSAPTVYKKIRSLKPKSGDVKCFEYDRRFQMYGQDYIFYDFNDPLDLDVSLKNHFDVVIADPPFLSDDCLTQTAITIKFLAKDKIILCTGAVMQDLAYKLLQVQPCQFKPTHENHLQNEFLCYANYESQSLESEH